MAYFNTKDNVRISYELEGAGRPVVLIHGWSCNRHYFDKQTDLLKQHYRVLSYDARGHGDSYRCEQGLTMEQLARDAHDLIEYCGLKDVILVGWSMGAETIFEYVRQFGCSNLAGICIVDMTPKMMTDDTWQAGMFGNYTESDLIRSLKAIAEDWEKMAVSFDPIIFAKKDYPGKQALIDWSSGQTRNNTPHCMLNLWLAVATGDYRDTLGTISVPTLICQGSSNHMFSDLVGETNHRMIRDSKLVCFENSGHALMLEEPDRFNRELMAFIESLH